jgi:hypothetical protein
MHLLARQPPSKTLVVRPYPQASKSALPVTCPNFSFLMTGMEMVVETLVCSQLNYFPRLVVRGILILKDTQDPKAMNDGSIFWFRSELLIAYSNGH